MLLLFYFFSIAYAECAKLLLTTMSDDAITIAKRAGVVHW